MLGRRSDLTGQILNRMKISRKDGQPSAALIRMDSPRIFGHLYQLWHDSLTEIRSYATGCLFPAVIPVRVYKDAVNVSTGSGFSLELCGLKGVINYIRCDEMSVNTLKDILHWIRFFSNEFPSARHRSAWMSLSPAEDWDASEGGALSSEQRCGGSSPLTCSQSAV